MNHKRKKSCRKQQIISFFYCFLFSFRCFRFIYNSILERIFDWFDNHRVNKKWIKLHNKHLVAYTFVHNRYQKVPTKEIGMREKKTKQKERRKQYDMNVSHQWISRVEKKKYQNIIYSYNK